MHQKECRRTNGRLRVSPSGRTTNDILSARTGAAACTFHGSPSMTPSKERRSGHALLCARQPADSPYADLTDMRSARAPCSGRSDSTEPYSVSVAKRAKI